MTSSGLSCRTPFCPPRSHRGSFLCMATSQYATILNYLVNQVQNLGLMFTPPTPLLPVAVPVYLRKLPKAEEVLETPLLPPVIHVAPQDRPEDIQPWSTEDEVLVKYGTDVVLIAAGNSNFTDINMDLWFRWREQERRLFQFGLQPTFLNVFFAEVTPYAPMDREALNKNYEYSGLAFRFWTVEPRTN